MSESALDCAVRYCDLFCGIGGFRFAIEQVCRQRGIKPKCVLSSDIDESCQTAYRANFGEDPAGDVRSITAEHVPDHDVLLAGFPASLSAFAEYEGFEDIEDIRGTLFFEIERICKQRQFFREIPSLAFLI